MLSHFASHILVFVHIFGGCLGIITGFLALSLRKGSRNHRRVGNVFFGTMLIMSGVGAFMAFVGTDVKGPNIGNVMGGSLTFYMTLTAWRAGRHRDGEHDLLDWIACLAVAVLGVSFWYWGFWAGGRPQLPDDPPHQVGYVFGTLALLCLALDLRMLLWGLYGAQRIARHLWRMLFALFIAASSFFIGQPQVFPHWLHASHLLFVPSLIVIAAMIYWLIRVLAGKQYKKPRPSPPRAGPVPAAEA